MTESNRIFSKAKTTQNWVSKRPLWQKVLAVALLAVVIVVGYRQISKSSSSATTYQTAQVEQKDLVSTLSTSGNVQMGSQFGVSSSVTGVVEDIYVKNGDVVKAGQQLFKVKSTASPQDKASAYASYQNAKNSMQSANQNKSSLDIGMWQKQQAYLTAQDKVKDMENNLDDYTDLARQAVYSSQVTAQKDYALAEQKYKESDLGVTAASASLNSSLLAYQATQNATITAPTDGMIANLAVQKGDAVTASSNSTTSNGTASTTSTTAMYVTNFSDVVMKASVNEVDLPKVSVGQKATVTLDAFADKTFVGTVSRIDRIGTNSSNVVTFNVYITLLSPPENIGSGMTASGIVQLDSRQNVLSVPSAAITTANGVSTVRVLNADNTVTEKTVQIGLITDTETEITSGLTAGENVVTGTTSAAAPATSTSTTSVFGGGNRGLGGATGGNAVRISR